MAKGEISNRMVVIGGSAGSLEVILKIIPELPTQSGASFVIVVHRKNEPDSVLRKLLSTRTTMKVREAEDKDPVLPDTIYLAPPDYHLLLENRHSFSLDSSEKVHHSRPSLDVTFESVAHAFEEASIGVLLSGANADGAEGLKTIKDVRGLTIAQNPLSADVGFMPQQAINIFKVDYVLDASEIGPMINRLLTTFD